MTANHSTECVLQCNVTQECDFVQITDDGANHVTCHLRGNRKTHIIIIKVERSKSQIGWIFKSKANDSYCLYDSGPMVRHYALNYGFHTFPNLLKNLSERHVALFMYTNA